MKTCDLCGEETQKLIEVKEIYQLDDMKEVCPSCEKALNEYVGRVNRAVRQIRWSVRESWFKRIIRNTRARRKIKDDGCFEGIPKDGEE